jgi:hypothetical protein
MKKITVEKIRAELERRPLKALARHERACVNDPDIAAAVETLFGPRLKLARFGRSLTGRQLVAASADEIVALCHDEETQRVASIGKAFEALVVEGTQQQQLCGRIAIALGDSQHDVTPLLKSVARNLIDALQVVLRVGATTTRDTAVEGLGALLKFYSPAEAKKLFGRPRKPEKTDDVAQQKINRIYFDRLERRRLMGLAVAGHPMKRQKFFKRLREPIAATIDAIRRRERNNPDELHARLLDALYSRADLLRTFPALIRQATAKERPALFREAIAHLKDAATFTGITEDEDAVLVAFAQFQESVFRTIDVMIKRGAGHRHFDRAIAQALDATPRTLVGPASVCNAQVRATVALLRTASRLISEDHETSKTKGALTPIFGDLAAPSPWPNLGITEGCYAILPFLASNKDHDGLSKPALESLFKRIKSPPPFGDLAAMHHQLVASASFRRLILRLMRRTDELSENDADSLHVQRDVSRLLSEPTADQVLTAFQTPVTWAVAMQTPVPRWTAAIVIAGTAFENDLLDMSARLFEGFDDRVSLERLLLTRILAAQLRATSQDSRKIARYAALRDFFANGAANRAADRKRIEKIDKIVTSLPARAAQAADPDLQDFLEHCGRRAAGGPRTNVEDLPGHVLAMVSDKPSSRIADAIAREIDLHRRHWKQLKSFDFAKLLYQVALRGPNESIFGHLLPRVDDADRAVVSLFYRHVKSVRADAKLEPDQLLKHVDQLANEISDETPSDTLRKLKVILTCYRGLFANESAIWDALTAGDEGGDLAKLFGDFDEIVKMTHVREPDGRRESLLKAYAIAAAQLQKSLQQYRELPVGEFELRAEALRDAREVAAEIERRLETHPGLRPPERVMLISLLQRLQDFFQRTTRWYCNEPQRRKKARKEGRDPERFFFLFASPTKTPLAQVFAAAQSLSRDDLEEALAGQFNAASTALALAGISTAAGVAPAEFPEQRDRFEKLFAEWMESELDVDSLHRHFHDRWAWPFRRAYEGMTNLAAVSVAIVVPCVVAVLLHFAGLHKVEGVGFFLLEAGVLIAAFVSLIPRLRAGLRGLWRRLRGANATNTTRDGPSPYYFESLVPRLARLIVVPLALTVEFDHSYSFPLHASTLTLVLLIALSFFATRFFVDREIIDASDTLDATPERVRLGKVVALALSHAFLISVLLATIFGSHADGVSAHVHSENWLDRMPDERYHHRPYFAGILPRDVRFEPGSLLPMPKFASDELCFKYYPTVILAWTALGLFIGVFLEGFLEGKRLRGGEAKSDPES